MPIGFKEWEVVCGAMAAGTQSIILRKGGIAEGREGFQFKHPEFYLFPTLFHAQLEKIRPEHSHGMKAPGAGGDADRKEIGVTLFAKIEFHRVIENWDVVAALQPFHIWAEQEVRKRFEWEEARGISLALVRLYRLTEPWMVPNEKAFGGCRSWITLPERSESPGLEPILDDTAFEELRAGLQRLVGK